MSSQKRRYELKARAESRERTRERIAAAAAELHEEVGVASTTVADIARRAGVQRLTVYNHFPDLDALLPACAAHHMSLNPPPDFAAIIEAEGQGDPLRRVLEALYRWFREDRAMQTHLHADRTAVPELDAFMSRSMDVALDGLADGLAEGLGRRGKRAQRTRALVRVALDFWTWRRLDAAGLDDRAAAGLMADAVAAA
jgi:AcrR family transcriptional regulator